MSVGTWFLFERTVSIGTSFFERIVSVGTSLFERIVSVGTLFFLKGLCQ